MNPAGRQHVEGRPQVWTYWEGPKPGWIELCERTIRRHIDQVQWITPETWPYWHTESESPAVYAAIDRQLPNVKSDAIRAHQLYHYGGIWIDADAIVFRDVRPIFHRLRTYDFVAYRVGRPNPQVCSALIGSHAGGRVADSYWSIMRERLGRRRRLPRLALGPRVLNMAARRAGKRLALIPTARVHPIHWQQKGQLTIERSDAEHAKVRDWSGAFCCMLTHRALQHLRALPADELLDHPSYAGYLFRLALGVA